MILFEYISLEVALTVLVRTLVIFFFSFLLLRVIGKRPLSHLTYVDLLLIIALGSAVGDVMIYDESVVKLLSSVIAITAVAIFVKVFKEMSSRSEKVSAVVSGTARLVIKNGEIIKKALEKEDMSEEELMGLLRVKGFESAKDVKKAFVEAGGELSVVTNHRNHS